MRANSHLSLQATSDPAMPDTFDASLRERLVNMAPSQFRALVQELGLDWALFGIFQSPAIWLDTLGDQLTLHDKWGELPRTLEKVFTPVSLGGAAAPDPVYDLVVGLLQGWRFHSLGIITFLTAFSCWMAYQILREHRPGPLWVFVGLPAISILLLLLWRAARSPGRDGPRLQRLSGISWILYVGVPLYVCGHFFHMMTRWKIIGLRTPEYGQHTETVMGWPAFMGWSELNWRMLLDGRPHYRWLEGGGYQAYPFAQPWLYILLSVLAATLWVRHFLRTRKGDKK